MIDPPPAQTRRLTAVDGTGLRAQMPVEPLWQRRALAEGWWQPEAVLIAHAQAEVETARNVLEVLSVTLSPAAFTEAVHAVDEMFDQQRTGLCDCHRIEFEDVQPAAQASLW